MPLTCENAEVQPFARVFLDTSVVHHSIRAEPRTRRISLGQEKWGDRVIDAFTTEFYSHDPAARIAEEPLRTEIETIRVVCELAKSKTIELLWHGESQMEYGGTVFVPGSGYPELLQAGVTMVAGPICYSRMIGPVVPLSGGGGHRETQIEFLRSLTHKRFMQLQRACGAFQGEKLSEKQLLDAFHVWCAEEAKATHFLTTDFKLVKTVRAHKTSPPRVRVVVPSELVAECPVVAGA